jgi:hypothetical protein
MKKMNENQLQNLEAGKFWGWSCGSSSTNPVTGVCTRTCVYRILGFVNETRTGVVCGNEPGSNPTITP